MKNRIALKKIIIAACGVLLISAVVAIIVTAQNRATKQDAVKEEKETKEGENETIAKVGMTAPEFTARMLDGTEIVSADLRGKVVLLNFWATWCPPCRQEMARVQTDIIDRFAGREFVFIALSRGEEKEQVENFMKNAGYTFPVGLDSDKSVYNKFATNYIPRNFVIDRQGKVVFTAVGYEDEEFDEMISFLEGMFQSK